MNGCSRVRRIAQSYRRPTTGDWSLVDGAPDPVEDGIRREGSMAKKLGGLRVSEE